MPDECLVTAKEAVALIGRPYSTICDWTRRKLVLPVGTKRTFKGPRALRGRESAVYRLEDLKAVALRMDSDVRSLKRRGKEETMEELEAMIAERSKPENRPDWWFKSWEKAALEGDPDE